MQLSLDLAVQITAMVLMCLAGYWLCWAGLVDAKESHVLSRVAVYAAAPCSIIQSFQSELNYELLSGLGLMVVAALAIHIISIAVVKVLRKNKQLAMTTEEAGSVLYSNSGNLGIPLISGLSSLGPGYVFYVGGFLIVQATMLWSHGLSLMSGQPQVDVKKILKNPCIIAVGVGVVLFFTQIHLPSPVQSAISSLAACLGPLCMVVIGMTLSTQNLKAMFSNKRVFGVVFIRLIFIPIIVMFVLMTVGHFWPHPDLYNILIVCFICAIGPTASTIVQLAQIFDSPHVGYVSVINVMSTILCVITMPVMIYFFQWVLQWI